MTARDKDTLKSYFNTGDVPTEQEYADLIDSIFSPPGVASGHVIQEEGVSLPDQPKLNFIGPGVTATNNPVTQTTDVTISGSGEGGNVTEGPGIKVLELVNEQQVGIAGDTILIYHANHNSAEEAVTLAQAVTLVVSGDILILPPGVFAESITIPLGVGVIGYGLATVIAGKVTLSPESYLKTLRVTFQVDDATTVVGVQAPETGTGYLYNCKVDPVNIGAGPLYAVAVLSDYGSLETYDCLLDGRGVPYGNIGYAGYRFPSGAGSLIVKGGSSYGASLLDPFNE